MDTSILEKLSLHHICRVYLNCLSPKWELAEMAGDQGEAVLEGVSAEELEWIARRVEAQLVYQRVAYVYATSSCWNCGNRKECGESLENRISVLDPVNLEPWRAFFCSGYDPDFTGLRMETRLLEEMLTMFKGYGLPVKEEMVRQCLAQIARHWFRELKLTGFAVPPELEERFG